MRKIFVVAMICIAVSTAKAQFSSSVGASLFLVSGENTGSSTPYGVTYSPRYSFGSLSVGVPITIGMSGSYNSRSGVSEGSSFTYQLPLVVDYNFGLGAADDEDSPFGGYAGIGYSLFSTSYVGTFSSGTLPANGPMLQAGVRFLIKEKIISLGGSYLKGGGDFKANVIGIRLTYGL